MKQHTVEEILKAVAMEFASQVYDCSDKDTPNGTAYIMTDTEDDYYIMVAIPRKTIKDRRIEGNIGAIKAAAECSVIFQADDCPKSPDRLFVLISTRDSEGNHCDKEHLNYDQWKMVFDMGIDKYVKRLRRS